MVVKPVNRSKPGALGFIAALLCTSAFILVAAWSIFYAADLKASMAAHRLKELVDSKNWDQEQALRLIHAQNLERTVVQLSSLVDNPVFKIPTVTLEKLVVLIGDLENLRGDIFTNSSMEFLFELETSPAYADSVQANLALGLLVRDLKKSIKQLEVASKAQLAQKKEIKGLRADLLRLVKQHELLSTELSSVFGVASEYNLHGVGDFSAYSSGVLESLPKLNNVPDGLMSLGALRASIEQAGGKFGDRPEDPVAPIVEKISSLQATSRPIVERAKTIETQLAEKGQALQNTTELIQSEQASIKTRMPILLLFLSAVR